MSKIAKFAVASLSALAAYYSLAQDGAQFGEEVKSIEQNIAPWLAEECTEALEVECAVDIERTVRACAKAFETEGADIIADIKCARDILADKKHCWPCICAEAKKKGWHVIGC